jgi:hypothetical protein
MLVGLLSLLSLTASVSAQEESINLLWIEGCDPRIASDVCSISDSIEILEPFYEILEDWNAELTYGIPLSEAQLREYDVIIANYCSFVLIPLLTDTLIDYLASGGSVLAAGDNFCYGFGAVSSVAATALTEDFGIVFTDDDDSDNQNTDDITDHPITEDVEEIFIFRHAYLEVTEPAETVIEMNDEPLLAVYDGDGTIVAIPDTTFQWDADEEDNGILWYNILRWLAEQSREKREWDEPASDDPLFCVLSVVSEVNMYQGPGADFNVQREVSAGHSFLVIGQALGEDGSLWWQTCLTCWFQQIAVKTEGACDAVPEVGVD